MTAGFTDKLILLKGYLKMAAGIDNLQLPFFVVPDLFQPQKIVIPSGDLGNNELFYVSPTTSPKATSTSLPSTHSPYMSFSYSSTLRSGSVPVDNPELDSSNNDVPLITNSRPPSLVPEQKRLDPSIVESKSILFLLTADILPRSRSGSVRSTCFEIKSYSSMPYTDKPRPCSLFYLAKSGCRRGENCRHAHDYFLDANNFDEMRSNARNTPCPAINKGPYASGASASSA